MTHIEYVRVRRALEQARSLRESFPHARLRVTPAMHQILAESVIEEAGGKLLPEGIIVSHLSGIRVELDADTPDPGWILDTWRDDPGLR